MADTHDYDTKYVPGRDVTDQHVLVGRSGGLSAVYGTYGPIYWAPGIVATLVVETEHGTLYLDPTEAYEVLDYPEGRE
jgi:hypothetical protein